MAGAPPRAFLAPATAGARGAARARPAAGTRRRAPARAAADLLRPRRRGGGGAAAAIVRAFVPEPYAPYPVRNAHAQTVLGALWPAPAVGVGTVRLPTADGRDVVYVDVVGGAAGGRLVAPGVRDVAVVLHGLEAGSRAAQTRRIAAALAGAGFHTLLPNFRSCAAEAPLPASATAYHAGFFDDAVTVLRALPPGVRVWLVGYSLGANVVVNLLGHLAEAGAPALPVVAAAGLSTPWDPASAQRRIDAGVSGLVYARTLAASIARKVVATAAAGVRFPPAMSLARVAAARTIAEIDDAYVAPVYGFAGRAEYYARVDARQHLRRVRVPAYFVGSANDPFFDHGADARGGRSRSLPTAHDVGDAPVMVYTPETGGHCGFPDFDGVARGRPMYGARELARFCAHVRDELDRVEADGRPAAGEAEGGGEARRPAKRQRRAPDGDRQAVRRGGRRS